MHSHYNNIQVNVSFIPNGTCSVNIPADSTIGDLRNKCWNQRKSCFDGGKTAGKFRLVGAELYLNDFEPVSRLVKFANAFDDDGGTPTVLYVPTKFMYDSYARQNCRADPNLPIGVRMSGMLEKNSSGGSRRKWQKRFFVYQNCTLFWYSDENSFRRGDTAKQFIAVGGITPKTNHPDLEKVKKPFVFLLELPDHLQTGKKGDKNMYMFAANSQVEMENWIRALKRGVFVRRVSVCMMALPALSNEQVLSLEGIFRLAGDRGTTKNIENGIDKANFPNFVELLQDYGASGNVHCVADVMKRSLKFMNEPLIPFSYYQSAIAVEFERSEEVRIQKLRGLIMRIPHLNRTLLEELFRFLNFAMRFSNVSKMTSNNLAIVFAPNVLRPEEETPQTMMDTDNKNRVISLLIERANDIFETEEEVQPSRQAPPPSLNAGHHPRPMGPPPTQQQLGTPPRMLSAANTGGIAPPPMLSGGLPARRPPRKVETDMFGRPSIIDEDDDLVVVNNSPAYTAGGRRPPGPPAKPPSPIPSSLQPAGLNLHPSNSLPEISQFQNKRVHSAAVSHSGLPKVTTRPAAKTVVDPPSMSSRLPPPGSAFQSEPSPGPLKTKKPFRLGHSSKQNDNISKPPPSPHKKSPSPRPKRPAGPPPADMKYRGMKIPELNEKMRELESQRTQRTNENRTVRERIEQITEHVGIFQSTYEDKLNQYLNETIPSYNDYHQAFVELVSSEQKVPAKDIQTQLEKLHEKVMKTQKDHMASLSALTRFYENCVDNLEKIEVQPTEDLTEEIDRIQKAIEQKKAVPPAPSPPKPPPKPVAAANLVIAIADYSGGYHPETELTFSNGESIILTNEEDEAQGWFQGKTVNGDGTVGWFPASFVQRVS